MRSLGVGGAMRQSVRDIWTEFNAPLEGRLHFMYLDIKGLVTTGMGNLIDATGPPPLRPPTDSERAASHEQARQLAWQASDGSSASPDQIDAEWDQIKARLDQARFGGGTFGQFATLFISDDEIDRLVFGKLDQMESVLKGRASFADFDNFPADAQLGLLSMSWGMGPMFNFPKFQGFVEAGDWNSAASECRFQPDTGTITTRNDRDQQLFRNAAAVIDQGLDPDALVWSSTA
jgi:GH24 family phage-related lysozyme (muramidase)